MAEFKAKIIAELDTSKVQSSINKIGKNPIKLSNVKIDSVTVDASKIVSQIQSALSKVKINIPINGIGNGNGSGNAKNSLTNRINNELANGSIDASVERLNAQFQKTYGFLTKIGSVNLSGTKLEQFGNTGAEALKRLETEFQQLQVLENNLSTAKTPEDQIQAYERFRLGLTEFRNELNLVNAESKVMATSFDVSKIDNGFSSWLEKNSKATRVFGDDIDLIRGKISEFQSRLASGDTVTQGELMGLTQQINNLKTAAESAGAVGQTFGDRLKGSFDKLSRYVSAATVIYTTIRATKQMVNSVIELDDALVDLQKTTTASSKELNSFYYQANDIAKEYGTTTREVIQSTADWSRLGLPKSPFGRQLSNDKSAQIGENPGMDNTEGKIKLLLKSRNDHSCMSNHVTYADQLTELMV